MNQTLLHLALIEDNLHTGYWNNERMQKIFSCPVEQYVLEAAASKRKNKFKYGLNLMTAPLKHDKGENYQIGVVFSRGDTALWSFGIIRNIWNFRKL